MMDEFEKYEANIKINFIKIQEGCNPLFGLIWWLDYNTYVDYNSLLA